jgi:uncharacterized membrane protein
MFARELLDLVLRWVHVIAAIMWIGNSLLFNWLDRNLKPAARVREGSQGEIWLLHSGAFYEVEKTLTPGVELPRPLHWFKWQAYTTWLSGAALLVVVYYFAGGAVLAAPGAGLGPAQAIAIGSGTLLAGLLGYEVLWRSPLARTPALGALVSFVLLLLAAWALGRVFTGRAAFLHIGALLGTIMAANVKTKIVPSQRAQVAAVERGEPPQKRLSEQAKLRSIHNNYMTFPVIALMVSSHFPSLYGQRASWVSLAVLVLGGAAVRHILNIRFTWRPWVPALGGTIALSLAALFLLGTHGAGIRLDGSTAASSSPGAASPASPAVTFEDVQAIVQRRCTVCHSAAPAIRTFGVAPGGISFDRAEDIRRLADRIELRAVTTRTMPPANLTFMSDDERAALARWLRSSRE